MREYYICYSVRGNSLFQNEKSLVAVLFGSELSVASVRDRKAVTVELTAAIGALGRLGKIASMTVLCGAQAEWLLLGVNYL